MGQDTDSERLKILFEAAKIRDGFTQASFGKQHGIGTQGMVWQYLNGKTPLNIEVATKFASALHVKIREFSPSLADEIDAMTRFSTIRTNSEGIWPFSTVTPEIYAALPKLQRDAIEATASAFAKARESPDEKKNVSRSPNKKRDAA